MTNRMHRKVKIFWAVGNKMHAGQRRLRSKKEEIEKWRRLERKEDGDLQKEGEKR